MAGEEAITITDAGGAFAAALAAKDAAALTAVLAAELDFEALTPRRHWTARTPAEVVDQTILGAWFDHGDEILELCSVRTDQVGDRGYVGYRLRVRTEGRDHLVEQQAYYNTDDAGRISWLRVLCSGYQPL